MSGFGLLITAVLLVVALAWLALPWLRKSRAGSVDPAQARERDALLTSYERILNTIRDLDEDFQVGKLSQAAYTAERARWAEQGAATLEALEKIGGRPAKATGKKARKAAPAAAHETPAEDPVEQAIAAYARARDAAGRGTGDA
jgi:hypothetical protein